MKSAIIDQSQEFKVFDWLKFPLSVLVVLVHSHITGTSIRGETFLYEYDSYPVFNNISFLVSEIVAALAVPSFFVISGYLFFRGLEQKNGRFDVLSFAKKLQRRSRTLLLPYILWNAIYLLIFIVGQNILPSLLSSNHMLIKDYHFLDFLNAFWAGFDGYPICPPLWFIRDLMVMIILSPIIYYLFRYTKVFPVILFLILWLLGMSIPFEAWNFKSAFFFYGGGYFAYRNQSVLTEAIRWKRWLFILYLLAVVVAVVCYNLGSVSYMVKPCIKVSLVFGVPAFLALGYYMMQYKQKDNNGLMKGSDFFIFGFHVLPLSFIIKILLKLLTPQSEIAVLFVYLVSPTITIIMGLTIFACLKRLFPGFASLLTGGRL